MARARLWQRAIRPPDDVVPNENDPLSVPPATVGPNVATPGDAHGLVVETAEAGPPPPVIRPSAWSGWPQEWGTPNWGRAQTLTDIAWACVNLNSTVLASMDPYLVNAADSVNAEWLRNPDPDIYYAWDEFARQLFWDYQVAGEVFVLVTGRYATGWPARFHVVPPWAVNAEMDQGFRRFSIGSEDVTADLISIRYQSTVDDARGHGPLEAAGGRVVAAGVLARYATNLAARGGIPASVLEHPEEISPEQAAKLKADWVQARLDSLGEPAVLTGGIKWSATQLNPKDMALVELSQITESRIAIMLGVPPTMVGLPSGGDPMTYANVTMFFDQHWRQGLRPHAKAVLRGLSEKLLPRGTWVEVNEDAYVRPEPLERAQTWQILANIKDDQGNPVVTVEQIQQTERLTNATPQKGAPLP